MGQKVVASATMTGQYLVEGGDSDLRQDHGDYQKGLFNVSIEAIDKTPIPAKAGISSQHPKVCHSRESENLLCN
jgi:hypothetical protein